MRRRSRTAQLVYGLLAVAICCVLLFPLYWLLNSSLQRRSDLFSSSPSWFPLHPDFSGYTNALTTQLPSLGVSMVIATVGMVVGTVIAVPAAYALAKLRLRFTLALVFIILLVQMLPVVVSATGLYALFNDLGLLNTYPGLIAADLTLAVPFSILLLRSFIVNVPDSLAEAARVDGAGYIRTLWSIIIPASRNGIITAAVFTFLFCWSDFIYALTFSTSGQIVPITLSIFRFIGADTIDWNGVLATSIIASIPPVVLLVVAQRNIAAGITAGAVKD